MIALTLYAVSLAGPVPLARSQDAQACPPEHAAMGHCTPEPPAEEDAACPPEHAAMGHCTPAKPKAATPPPAPAPDPDCAPEHAAMGHCTPAKPKAATAPPAPTSESDCAPEHAAMGHCTPAKPQANAALAVGNQPAPAAPAVDYADRIWGREAMASSRGQLYREHGGGNFSQIMIDIAEIQFRQGREGYRWEGEGWFGGDINRLVVKTEGEGGFGDGVDGAEVQALYSRAVDPYFNLQAGIRTDIRPTPSRSFAALGVEGLAPYWFELEAHAFVSTEGEVLGRIAASYDQRLTQRLILQPRIELNLSAQDAPEIGLGGGLTDAELDLRLRYEIRREFAPYVGLSWERRFGDTGRLAGDRGGDLIAVAGVRAWF